jgi:hypothetical protein
VADVFVLLGGYFLTDCCAITHSPKNIKEIFFILNFIKKKKEIFLVLFDVSIVHLSETKQKK